MDDQQTLASELDATKLSLRKTQLALSEFARAATNYQRRLDEDLRSYRGQRAWRLMLAVRAVYTQAFRGGLKGKLRLLKSLFQLGRGLDLDAQELDFPQLREYIPPAIQEQLEEAKNLPAHLSMRHPQRKTDVIVLAIIEFDFRFQRPQQLAVEMARRGHRVFWVSPARRLPNHSAAAYESVWLRDNIHHVRLHGAPADIYAGELTASISNESLFALRQLFRDWAISDSLLLVQFPYWRKLACSVRKELGSLVVYDCMDDWDSFENVSPFARGEEPALAREADLLVVSAKRLEEKFSRQGLASTLVRNGVDDEFYRTAATSDLLAGIPRPIAGYFGAIADWFDLELLYRVARERPRYSFVLIGQVFGQDSKKLEALPNV
ncbi:MAG: hypothetical protein NTY38_22490, partial [Acidobacteria bacterium]|nr:hypothetical protein [Acidobacteriota bacterium]